ncbi:MAG TPA: cytochrome P450, partial [Reyranella sp.]|nr:cytochrome P450 [Reyranella sp.]
MADINQVIADPKMYADQRTYDALFTGLRRDSPVHWVEPDGYRPFWLVTRHADIMEIERQSDRFLNEPRLILSTIEDERRLAAASASKSALRTLVNMDNPDHRLFRAIAQTWFMPPNLQKLEARVAALAREFVDRMAALDGDCDFARDVANWYPLRVIMTILGVPAEDEPLML